MQKIKPFLILLLIIFLLPITGCWGLRETDEIAFVMLLGFDKGEKNNLLLTLSIANPRVAIGGGEGGGDEDAEKNREIVGVETFGSPSMLDLLNTTIDRHIYLQHANAIIFSEELAEEGLNRWLSQLMRFREIRGTAQTFICRGKASDLIQDFKPLLELNPAKQMELIRKMSTLHGIYPTTQLTDLYDQTKSHSRQAVLPLVAVHEGETESAKPGLEFRYLAGEVPVASKSKVQHSGAAVLKGDKLVGFLDGEQARYYLMLSGKFGSGVIGIKDPIDGSGFVSVHTQQGQAPKYDLSLDENGDLVIDVNLFLEMEVIATDTPNNFEQTDLRPTLEEAFSRQTEQKCNEVIRYTQDELGTDIFGFGERVKREFLTVQDWEDFAWLELYPHVQVNVNAHSHIRRTGLLLKTSPSAGG